MYGHSIVNSWNSYMIIFNCHCIDPLAVLEVFLSTFWPLTSLVSCSYSVAPNKIKALFPSLLSRTCLTSSFPPTPWFTQPGFPFYCRFSGRLRFSVAGVIRNHYCSHFFEVLWHLTDGKIKRTKLLGRKKEPTRRVHVKSVSFFSQRGKI